MGLIDDLPSGPIALDTAILIYFIEDHPQYAPLLLPLFEQADRGARTLVTSALTLLEVLVVPLRANDRALADRYERLLTRSRGLRLVDLTRDVLRSAAELRAVTTVRTPDAVQIAAAMKGGCRALLTNERRLPSLPDLRVMQLSAYA